MIKPDNILSALASFALNAYQFPRVDVVPVMRRVGPCVAATRRPRDHARAVIAETTEQNAATLVRIGLLTVRTDRVIVLPGKFQHGIDFVEED
jgi:hypothetical protein